MWDCFKVAHVFALRTDFQVLKKKLRATLFWDGPLRIQGNWPLSTEVIFSPDSGQSASELFLESFVNQVTLRVISIMEELFLAIKAMTAIMHI